MTKIRFRTDKRGNTRAYVQDWQDNLFRWVPIAVKAAELKIATGEAERFTEWEAS